MKLLNILLGRTQDAVQLEKDQDLLEDLMTPLLVSLMTVMVVIALI